MKPESPRLQSDFDAALRMPPWALGAYPETLEDASFLSGAALSHLHILLENSAIPQPLLRDRLALHAAEACVVLSGRAERAAHLRDAIHLLRPGDLPGPAGVTYQCWRKATERPISVHVLARALPQINRGLIETSLGTMHAAPVTRAAQVLESVLTGMPRAQTAALILADAALGRAMGWPHLVPLLASGLRRHDLRKSEMDLRLACHRAVTASAIEAARLAADLARRVQRLHAVLPKLRAKGAAEAAARFLTQDAVAPAALTGFMSDRSARRLCDRLVDLGVVQELTGRDTFRLYGI